MPTSSTSATTAAPTRRRPAFISAVSPRCTVISVGRNNLFGHPAPPTIEMLARAGAKIYRTDEDGAVTISSDGTRFSAQAFLSR